MATLASSAASHQLSAKRVNKRDSFDWRQIKSQALFHSWQQAHANSHSRLYCKPELCCSRLLPQHWHNRPPHLRRCCHRNSNIQPQSQNIKFSIAIPPGGIPSSWRSDCSGLSLVRINQQNTPIVEKLLNIQIDLKNLRVTFEALFPFEPASFGNGLTIVAVTNSTEPFATANAAAANTIFGPGLIEINQEGVIG